MPQRKYLVMSVEDYLVLNRNSKDIGIQFLIEDAYEGTSITFDL